MEEKKDVYATPIRGRSLYCPICIGNGRKIKTDFGSKEETPCLQETIDCSKLVCPACASVFGAPAIPLMAEYVPDELRPKPEKVVEAPEGETLN